MFNLPAKKTAKMIERIINEKIERGSMLEKERIEKIRLMMQRTLEIRIEDLRSLLEFQSNSDLMNWIYSLPSDWNITVKGDYILFPTAKETLSPSQSGVKESHKESSIYCLFCENELEALKEEGPYVCANCGSEAPICEICKNIVVAGQKTVQSKCKHVFHKDHLVEWIKAKGTCPVCKEKLNEKSLTLFPINP